MSNDEPTTVDKLRGLPWSIASNSANTFFVQFTFFGSVFALFLNELGLSKSQMGFLFSLIPFFGLVALFVAPLAARHGYKRTFLAFFGLRKIITTFLLFTPWVAFTFGAQATLLFVSVITALFGLSRAIAETARFPWIQEFVPASVQGKYTANNNFFATLAGFIAVIAAGYVVGRLDGLTPYMMLIAGGVFFGFISVWLASFIPGGAPAPDVDKRKRPKRNLSDGLKDRNFLTFMAGVGLIILAMVPVVSFLPLFMREEVGLPDSRIIFLQIGTLAGSMAMSFVWGWAADRYGSKPVMLSGVVLRTLVIICLILMPLVSDGRLVVALLVTFLLGMAEIGWAVGSSRLLFVSVVPVEKKSDYMALYYAWIGIAGGTSQLIGGRIIDYFSDLSGTFLFIPLNPYTPLYMGSALLVIISGLVLRRVSDAGSLGVGQFAGILLRGNPFIAMQSLFRYQWARDEQSAVRVTERMGRSGSPLTVEELLDALHDPRFNVRFEAIVSIARMPADPRLTDALIEILNGTELALSVIAAWALGRIGDPVAYDSLREALDSKYLSIRAHSARALGALGTNEIASELVERLEAEDDKGLQMAYASALGKLGEVSATGDLLALMGSFENEGARRELALSLARLVGDERLFIQLLRQMRSDPGTATAQAIIGVRRLWNRAPETDDEMLDLLNRCADRLAHDEMEAGAELMSQIVRAAPAAHYGEVEQEILQDAGDRLGDEETRTEYLLLALHTLRAGFQK